MDERTIIRVSKWLSRHLRHEPGEIGLSLGPGGWVPVTELLAALARHGLPLSRARLDEVVAGNDKRRFAFDETGTLIRASQGHSVDVDLGLPDADPPATLFHGTAERFLPAILREGLRPRSRHDVHLSRDTETAVRVGSRHGKPVVLAVDAAAMTRDGHRFQVSENGVRLTRVVPSQYLSRH
ncbi:RNA 2'-phosphotransferase [Amycolatopsis methanolica]|uniref:Probable RNA 2'-phosphotransferase n=1 Tax=Amycolatopsis methanolica 239 TaxID=1068978 RepID=A0A076N310_AMYME|nr:RNA 2'-phosphotransferase [Amycolatopsis methanolica]AIJ25180.1 putative RNA 2'-phosphotransferase [Amycolatopsis methanolica 239]